MLAVLDCQLSGIAGDMLLSSLVDLGANRKKVLDAIVSCQNFLEGSKIINVLFEEVRRAGFRATIFDIKYEDRQERKGMEVYDAAAQCCDSLGLDSKARSFALSSINTLIEAEARVHGEDYANVHLHEAASVDTLADVIGSAVAMQDLGLFGADIYSSRVAIGGGPLTFSHGTITNPGSALLEIFRNRNFTLVGGPVDTELTTPTGAAMLVNLAKGSMEFYPALQPIKVGYGAGSKDLNFPNMLKVVLGKEMERMEMDTVYILETNVDDATGEVLGSMVDTLMEKGAKDVNIIPLMAKKGRPAYMIRMLCDYEHMNTLLGALIQESGTLGVRVQQTSRYIVPRMTLSVPVEIKGERFVVRVKVVKEDEKVVYSKPEYEDMRNIALKLNIPYRVASSLVNQAVMEKLSVLKQ
jgi:hypothetical protein